MNSVSLFSGIGGFDLGFAEAGFESSVVAERDRNCLELLGDKFSGAIQIPDVLQIPAIAQRMWHGLPFNYERWTPVFERLRAASVFCGGFPCQDLSVAGQRAGLVGVRSGLWFVFRRIIALFRPPWVVIENVPGLLSSNGGRDLFIILSGLAQLGYRWAYRVLDAQYFGLAQRRERVFIVASLGNYGCAEVLFERESLCWDSAPSRETGKRITGTLSARSEAGGGLGSDFSKMSGGLTTNEPKEMRNAGLQRDGSEQGLGCVSGGTSSRGDGPNGCGIGEDGDPMFTLQRGHQHAVAIGFDSKQGGDTQCGSTEEKSPPIRTSPRNAVAFQPRYFSRDKSGGAPDDISPPVCAVESRSRGDAVTSVAFTERTRVDGRNFESQEEVAYALTNPGSGGRTHSRQIATQSAVRRLTPTECERLQGFPDGYTAGQSDSVRYRQLGNAVAMPVAAWIAKRLKAQL